MTREEQMMNAADRYADEVCDESCTGAQVAETINDFCAGWRAADQHPHWIPVEERLPEYKWVLVCVGGKGYDIDIYKEGMGTWAHNGNNVTHWMPLPPAPRKEE